jgi:ABC-2 type transport system ATP-binding protein
MADMHGLDAAEGARRAQRLLDELKLTEAAHDYVTAYSLGMKKKMALAMVLLHQPKVLILDEPTTGLDPASSRSIRQLLRQYADAGRTVLLSTHWLDMADSLCDRVGVIHRGRLVACDAPAALRARAGGESTLEEVFLQLTAEHQGESAVA